MIVQCCVCKKIYDDKTKTWIKKNIKNKIVSHSYCDVCFKKAKDEIKTIRKELNNEHKYT